MNNQIDKERQFRELIEQCEQAGYFIEFRSLNQVQGSNARFIEDNSQKFGYQDLANLGFNHEVLNFHHLIVMDSQLPISTYLKQIFYQQEGVSPQFLLLRLVCDHVIIQVQKSPAVRPQLKLKIFPLSKIISLLSISDDKSKRINDKIAITSHHMGSKMIEYLLEGHTHHQKGVMISPSGHIDLRFYLLFIAYSQLSKMDSFDIYPIIFSDKSSKAVSFNDYYNNIHQWVDCQNDIMKLFDMYYKSSGDYLKPVIITDIFQLCFSRLNNKGYDNSKRFYQAFSSREKEVFGRYFGETGLKDKYHELMFWVLFSDKIEHTQRYQINHQSQPIIYQRKININQLLRNY